MAQISVKNSMANTLGLGAALITLLVMTNLNSDPVNAPKLALLGVVAGAVIPMIILSGGTELFSKIRLFFLINLGLGLSIVWSLLTANSPISQMAYGVYGRNTGAITYLLCILLALSSSLLDSRKHLQRLLMGFAIAGLINVFYSGWVLFFGDFIGWQNPYKTILGTFGNPDFISAFLGMFIALCLSYLFSETIETSVKIALAILSVAALKEIVASHAIQGIVITCGAFVIIFYHFLRNRISNRQILLGYIFISGILGLFAIFGTLQKGPFGFVYKKSVSLRGTYWNSGIDMGRKNILSGVGFDGYGDWYQRSRPPVALIDTPGIATVSNTAHNVFIDIFSSGGIFVFMFYIALILLGFLSIGRVMTRAKHYDPIFVAISTIWICYQTQSVISINQVGLVIWGWIFTGALIAYERMSRSPNENNAHIGGSRKNSKQKTSELALPVYVLVGSLIGFVLAAPPLTSDMKWSKALKTRQLAQIEASLVPSYFNPSNVTKFLNASNLFLANNRPVEALKYAEAAARFNPDSFDAWKFIFKIPVSTDARKAIALSNMKRLDPKNPDVTKY